MASQVRDGNVASRLEVIASLAPGGIAIAEPCGPRTKEGTRSYSLTTFDNLEKQSDAIAAGLVRWGLRPGMRVAMLVPFGAQFIELVFALLKSGVTVILIDPGIGRKHLIKCLSDAKPDGFVGITKAMAIRTVLKRKFPAAKWNVTVGRRLFWGGKTLDQIKQMGQPGEGESRKQVLPRVERADPAAIIFTTGSTGPPKGVLYTHGTFHAQIDRIRERYDIHRGSRDLACFPLFGLFDAVMGVTTIIPDMDPTRPADVDPVRLIEAAEQWEVDQSFGSPALWNTVLRWCEQNGVQDPFPSMRRILSAGAPVPASTMQRLRRLLHEDADIYTPYGATEALPLASIESRQIIEETGPASVRGKGVCVGTRFDDVQWKVIAINDGPIASMDQVQELPQGKTGELMVSGPMVTTQYVVRADQNALHKVTDGDRVWHRMGDVGYLDRQDRFWFCGRKAHRVTQGKKTWYTVPCEAIFNAHPGVYRCALVGRGTPGNQTPVVLVEPVPEAWPKTEAEKEKLCEELRTLASLNPITCRIADVVIRDQPLPTDIRHNSKIFRERLAAELNGEQ
ncbi:peptide synthase [Rhodopirellula sp. MGV]|nr:peptide synthase [Rhodopirellula sp. MGV]PNY35912.1 peptide synthase [Rhodopirellula baltica]